MIPVRQAKLDSAESILEYGAAMDVGLVGLFRDLVRLETELVTAADCVSSRQV